jgi:hypothetical protein
MVVSMRIRSPYNARIWIQFDFEIARGCVRHSGGGELCSCTFSMEEEALTTEILEVRPDCSSEQTTNSGLPGSIFSSEIIVNWKFQ